MLLQLLKNYRVNRFLDKQKVCPKRLTLSKRLYDENLSIEEGYAILTELSKLPLPPDLPKWVVEALW